MNFGFTDLLALLGALGLFLYGMKVMSDALMELAGERMRNILATTTSNRVFAVLTGFLITATIQSSSATTLMVVSFVNASLLTLTEAVGVILGAHIGTTVTAWLITILGFKVKISAIAIPLVGLGFLLSLSRDHKRKYWGLFIVGFALLFIGLEFLKNSVPDIRSNPEALKFLAEYTTKGYLSVLLFLFIGTALTLVLQSSSATMALTLLMTHEGWIPFDMAAAMVLGENVGTTITANLAALVANYQAKRAARAHFISNTLGVLWMLIVFYPFLQVINAIVMNVEGQSPFMVAAAIPVSLSLFHTAFNIINTTLLIGFIGFIVRIVEKLIPAVIEEDSEIDQPRYLTEESLQYPQTGIKALLDESVRLLENAAYKAITHGLGVHREELESGKKLKKILRSRKSLPIDIDRLYVTKIKLIYSKILAYATTMQSRLELTEKEIETIRNILVADRMLVQVIKRLKPLHDNIDRYMASDNAAIRKEYNRLRRRILKVVREIHRIGPSANLEEHMEKLRAHRDNAEEIDVLLTGCVDKLVLTKRITDEMATSLMNDSANAMRVTQMLVDISTLFYTPLDAMLNEIDESEAVSDENMKGAILLTDQVEENNVEPQILSTTEDNGETAADDESQTATNKPA
ncbi:MAG: Na/Pi cotransporter family protein [Gammaproteobacteria bacterium]|nr:MAG: Na/Pi cotransporter family protein [Gammaproteobacteria bacterium]